MKTGFYLVAKKGIFYKIMGIDYLIWGAVCYASLWLFFNKKELHIGIRLFCLLITNFKLFQFLSVSFFTPFEKVSFIFSGVLSDNMLDVFGFESVSVISQQSESTVDIAIWSPVWFGLLFLIIHNRIPQFMYFNLRATIHQSNQKRSANKYAKDNEKAHQKEQIKREKARQKSQTERENNQSIELEIQREKTKQAELEAQVRLKELDQTRPEKEKRLTSILDKIDDL
jgi:hypothetical protein